MREAAEHRLGHALPEARPRVLGHDFAAQSRWKPVDALPENIETNTRVEKCHFGAHIGSHAWGGVQSDGFPDRLDLLFGDLVSCEEPTSGVCSVDLEAFARARELLVQAEIVECGSDVEELRIEAESLLTSLLSRKQIHPKRVIEDQLRGVPAKDVGRLVCERGIRDDGQQRRDAGHLTP